MNIKYIVYWLAYFEVENLKTLNEYDFVLESIGDGMIRIYFKSINIVISIFKIYNMHDLFLYSSD